MYKGNLNSVVIQEIDFSIFKFCPVCIKSITSSLCYKSMCFYMQSSDLKWNWISNHTLVSSSTNTWLFFPDLLEGTGGSNFALYNSFKFLYPGTFFLLANFFFCSCSRDALFVTYFTDVDLNVGSSWTMILNISSDVCPIF